MTKKLILFFITLMVMGSNVAWSQGTFQVSSAPASNTDDITVTSVSNITLTYGNDSGWTIGDATATVGGTTFSKYIGGGQNPVQSSMTGTIYKFSPTKSGTLTIVVQNANISGKSMILNEDDTNISGTLDDNTTVTGGSKTTEAVSSSTTLSQYTGGLKISVTANKNYYFALSGSKVRFMGFIYAVSSSSTTYAVTYDANGATSGSVPTDATAYSSGASVTVKANSGNLAKTGYTFDGWNTNTSGTGTTYAAGTGTFNISANTTLYAKWTEEASTSTTIDDWDQTYSNQTNGKKGFTAAPTIPSGEGSKLTFEKGVRYSKWVINSRINKFGESTNSNNHGLGVFTEAGAQTTAPTNPKGNIHYVPGFVAEGILEAIDYYRTADGDAGTDFNIKPWFYAVQNWAINYDMSYGTKAGNELDGMSSVKIYSLIKKFATNGTFPDGTKNSNETTITTANTRFSDALTALKTYNTSRVITSSTNAKAAGGWWHKSTYANQMWCDGQYMGPATLAHIINDCKDYSKVASTGTDWDLINNQINISWNYLWNSSDKLLYHGFSAVPGTTGNNWATVTCSYDSSCKTNAAYWGRANSWYVLALVEILQQMDRAGQGSSTNATNLKSKLNTLIAGIVARQDNTSGVWYQVLDENTTSHSGNFLESSASGIFLTAIMRAQRLGYLTTDYTTQIKKGYAGLVNTFLANDGDGGINVLGCSMSASLKDDKLGTDTYYITGSDAKATNEYTEGKALGAFIMAAVEYERLYLEDPESSGENTGEVIGCDLSAELRDQNTPTGWTAVQLPQIPEITASNTFNITSYGASTSSEDNAAAINSAIAAANSAGGGMVIIPAGTWLSGPITMKSKVVLHLKAGTTLKMLEFGKYPDNTTHEKTWNSGFAYKDYTFIGNGSSAVDDVIIEGEGETSVIDGQGAPWWAQVEVAKANSSSFDRPACIRFKKGTRHLFRNFKTQNTPGVNITIGNKTKTGHVTIHDVWISNPDSEASSGASHNTDGIPIWEPYVNIYNCNISTGDDNIVVDSEGHHIHAWNINCGYGHGMSVGSYTVNVHDVIYEGVTFTNTGSGFRIKTSADRSGNDQTGSNGAVKNIICRNATMTGCPSPIKITSWYDKDVETPSSNTTSDVTETTPEFCNILFQNITETTGKSSATSWKHNRPVYLYGRPEMPVHDITLDNVNINSYLGMFIAFAKNITFKNGCKITNKKSSSSLLTTEYQAYSDNGSTLISANPSKYNGSETATTHVVKFMNGSEVYKTYNICPNSYAYPPTAPTKIGYTFKGWATTDGGTPVTLAQTELAAGGTFYAVWDDGSTPSTPTTVTGTETTPTATASNSDQVGLCYTIPATYVGGSGNSSKAIKFNLRDDKIVINVNPNYTITGFTFTGNDNYDTNGITISSVTVDGGSANVLGSSTTFATDKSQNSFAVSDINATSKITITASTPHDSQLNGTIVFTYKYNVQALALSSSSKTTSRNGTVTLKFNNPMAASTATATIGSKTFRPYVSGTTVTYAYTGLDYGQSYNFTLPANSLTDEFGQTYSEAINLTITTDARAAVTKQAFDKVVSNGDELAAAITEANNRSDKTIRYRIFIKKGAHVLPTNGTTTGGDGNTYPDPRTHLSSANVSFIGEDYTTTSFTNITPDATWDNGYGTACPLEGIGNGDVLIIDKTATQSYFQGVKITTSMGDGHGRDIAVNDQSNKTIMKDVCLWGYQDTYVSNNSGGRFYFDGGVLRGRTDYLCGKGDVYYNKVTLQQCGTGGYLAVPSVPMKYGYIFNECYIKKETSDVTYYLGRPWGSGTPIALFINTKVDAAPITEGWAEMSGGWPARFAEYNTKTTSGSSVSTSGRKTTFNTSYTNNPVLTQAEAELYSTMSLSMSSTDGWDPTEYTEQCAKPTASLSGSTLSWTSDSYASSWIVFKDGSYYANPITNSLTLTETGSYTVRAANAMGGLGEASSAVSYVDDNNGTVDATIKMTYVDGSNTSTSYGEVTEAKAGYNNINNNTVGLANSGWNCNWITYINIDASNVPAGRYIKTATLTAKVSGSTDSKRTTTWGAGYNGSAWSSTMTYEAADRSITTCGNTYTTSTKSATTFEDVTFDISDALVGDADKVATILIYETAAAGGSIKDVSVSVEYTNVETHTHTYGNPVWTWADDGSSALAKITCTKDASHVLSGNATVTSAVQTDATCTAMGTTRYTATITLNNTQYSDYKDVTDIAMTEHSYTYTDNGNGTHTKTCSTCTTVNSVESHTGECTSCNIYQLVDGTAYTNMQEKTYSKVYYQRTFSNTTWNALCVPFAINVTDYADQFDIAEVFAFCPYKDTNGDGDVTAEDDDMLIVFKKTEGNTVPGKPYLIRPKSATKYTITAADGQLCSATTGSVECATTKTTYTITGLYSPVSATAENRYYYVTANGIGYRTSGSVPIGAYRWFMVPESNDSYSSSTSSNAKTLYGIVVIGEDLDETTAIQLVNTNKTTAGAVYTLQGVKVADSKNLTPGIYIRNGRKFMVK